MVTIRNKRDQKLLVNLDGRRNLELLAHSTARVGEEDLASEHLKSLIMAGDVLVIPDPEPEKKDLISTGSKPRKAEPAQVETKANTVKTENIPANNPDLPEARLIETDGISNTFDPKVEKTQAVSSPALPDAERVEPVKNTEKNEQKEVLKTARTVDGKK